MRLFDFRVIARRQLPSYERKGATASEVIGGLVMVTFHGAMVDVETLYGVPVGASERVIGVHSGVKDTVVVASYRAGVNVLPMLDVLMSDRASQRRKSIVERHEVLDKIYSQHMSDEARKVFPLARSWSRGLLRAYDEVADIGGGLWLRVPDEPKAVLCMESIG